MSVYWSEGVTNVKELIRWISRALTKDPKYNWKLVYPSSVSGIDNMSILKTELSINGDILYTFYVKFERPEKSLNHILVTTGSNLNSTGNDIDLNSSNYPARFAWYRLSDDIILFEDSAIQVWMSFNENSINIVLQGDPSLDIPPYKNYLISYAYIGALESFEGADPDDKYNFGLTVSSDIFYNNDEMPEKYGKRTATCITDIGMVGTRTGTLFQAHLPKFSTTWEYADKNFISPSQWTHKYHMSDIIVYHAYDRERGKLQNVLIGDRSAVFHLDTLIINKDKENEERYVMFNVNAPYSILNNGPNALYGIALRRD